MSAPLSTSELLRWVATKATRSTRDDFDALLARTDFTQVAGQVLQSGTPPEKRTALRGLRELETPEARALARLALRDDAAEVRAMAAGALTHSRDEADWQALLVALDDADASVQHAVMDALARMDPAATSALLLERFGHASTSEQLLALITAQRLRLPDAVALARQGLASPTATTRSAAISLLARQTEEETDGLLLQALTDGAEDVRVEALRALSRRVRVPTSVFVPLLSSATAQVQELALQALVLRRDTSACADIARLLEAPSPSLRRSAIFATGYIRCTGSTPTLLELLARTRAEDERVDLITALSHLGSPEAWAALRGQLLDPAPRIRRAAVSAWTLATAPRDATRLLLERLREDPDAEVRMAIALALAESGRREGARALHLALQDAAPEVRRMAVRTLGRDTRAEAHQALREHQATERDPEVLRELATALDPRRASGNPGAPAERPLFDPAGTGQCVAEWLASPAHHPATDRVYFYEGGHLQHLDAHGQLHALHYTVTGDQLHLQAEDAPERRTAFTVAPMPPTAGDGDAPHRFRLELARDVLTGTDTPRALFCVQPERPDTDSGNGD
ncbi:HEAT repeat domain-containing protein [Corallococcus macrosporus]|uniref:HEAT repeat domain-containing protein n=1 Tax=Corallococcus macrosporus TaxID=35 RepID=UPI0005BC55ED|nr:HEAT repeat domain-containing protein [Corallococcus macrosporus]